MTVINTNAKALFSQAALKLTDRSMTVAMQQLSTGKRINSARDDAAGMAIVTRMTQQVRSLNQAVRNANDAINLIQTAEGATNEITDMMQRMRELAVQSVNDTNSNSDRTSLDLEFQQLKQQIVQIADNTEWNGFPMLNGKAGQQVGEMPLYKVTSDNQSGGVFIQPTTTKTITGDGAGEIQQFTLSGSAPTQGNFNVAGVDVDITTTENSLSAAADKIVTTLNNSNSFQSQGITVSHTVPSVVMTAGSGSANGSTAVSFKDMTAGQSVTVAGQTFTAANAVAASDVSTFFAGSAVPTSAQGALTGNSTLSPSDTLAASGSTFTITAGSGTASPVVSVSGSVTLNYSASNGDASTALVLAGSTSLTTSSVTTTRQAVTQALENIANGGKFLQSGALQLSIPSGAVAGSAVTAMFTNADNQQIQLTGTLSKVNPAVVNFAAADGLNNQVVSGDLSYTLQDASGNNLDLTTTPRALSMLVSVEGSIPALRDGDLLVNGVNIGPSLAADDLLSPRNNAAGSAIAKAAAINRIAVDQGISQGEIQAITFSGTPMAGTITVGGVNVQLTSDDNTPALAAAKIAMAMKASPLYDGSTGRSVTYANGSASINVSFSPSEGSAAKIDVQSGVTGLGSVVNNTQEYATQKPGTGVFAKVNENVYSGQAMTIGPVATGVIFINGYASADITTVYNNAQATRNNVVRAINLISDKTGVQAIDTGSDTKGIQLVAADGRNIEVRFDPTGSTNAASFGQCIGMREGVQSSTISLESKIQTPVVLSTSPSGDISRSGLVGGNYSKNESVLDTKPRAPVGPSVAQLSGVQLSGTVSNGKSVTAIINGTNFTVNVASTAVAEDDAAHTVTITDGSAQSIRDAFKTLINADSTLGVFASQGSTTGELQLTARTPGVPFTMSASTTETTSNATLTTSQITANQIADTKSLGTNDLTINGVTIRQSTQADDKFSNTLVSSSDLASSAIALAAAINDSSSITGVKAFPNPAEIDGSITSTATPVSGEQSLWVNGVQIQVDFAQNESAADRRAKVVAAINERTGQHGVTATDNGKGVSLATMDGRNLSVWFDSSQKDLNAADFGLDQGGSVAQVSKIQVSGATSAAGQVSVMVNGVQIQTPSLASGISAAATATALATAINASSALKNVTATANSDGSVIITSSVPGSAFDVRAPSEPSGSAQTMTLSTVTANSQGNNDVSAVDMSAAYQTNVLGSATAPISAMNIKTVYGTVRMVASAPMLPTLPGADGLTPSSLNSDGHAIQISAGANGLGSMSNFSALGFNEGSFGGRASVDMDPPRVGRLEFQVGSSANQIVTIDLADFGSKGSITGEITGDVSLDVNQRSVRIDTSAGASAVLTMLDTAMNKVNDTRATMGAVMNRLDHVITNLTNVSMNLTASRSQIEDVDYAQASTELAKSQIMQQAATAVLAQANTSQQSVLKLLGG